MAGQVLTVVAPQTDSFSPSVSSSKHYVLRRTPHMVLQGIILVTTECSGFMGADLRPMPDCAQMGWDLIAALQKLGLMQLRKQECICHILACCRYVSTIAMTALPDPNSDQ